MVRLVFGCTDIQGRQIGAEVLVEWQDWQSLQTGKFVKIILKKCCKAVALRKVVRIVARGILAKTIKVEIFDNN